MESVTNKTHDEQERKRLIEAQIEALKAQLRDVRQDGRTEEKQQSNKRILLAPSTPSPSTLDMCALITR